MSFEGGNEPTNPLFKKVEIMKLKRYPSLQ